MAVTVTMIGVGEAFDEEEANSSVLVAADGFSVLLDCGHAAIQSLWRRQHACDRLDAIYVTHQHADHVLGLVPLFARWVSDRRRRPVSLVSSRPTLTFLDELLRLTGVREELQAPFPVAFLVAEETANLGPFRMRVAPTEHSVVNYAVALEYGNRRLAFSGDGRPTEAARRLYADADLLLHECFLPSATECPPGHCDLPTVRTVAGPSRIGVYHVRADQRAAMRNSLIGDKRVFLPEAGDVLEV